MSERRGLRGRVQLSLLVLAVVLGIVVGLLFSLQRKMIYLPDSSQVGPAAEVIPGARDVTLSTGDGLELDAWFVPADAGSDTGLAVLVAPGNGGNREGRAGLARELSGRGLAVLLLDYRGYGGNPGEPSEEGLGKDADAAMEELGDLGYPPERTILFGESLGTGVVAALQERTLPAGLVLRSPFTELADLAAHHYPWLPARLLLRDRFPVLEHMRSTEVPVTVVYGDEDSVVPPDLSARVASASPTLVEEVVLRGADHNDAVMFGARVAEVVRRLADQLR